MGCWGITAFESDTGLDAVGIIRRNLPEDGNLKLDALIELMKENQWSLPDISDGESHSGAMALAEVMVKFLDGDISELDKRFGDVLSFTANKDSVRWISDYLSNTLDYKIKDAVHGSKWGGWFKEQDWIAWQDHMKLLIDRMDTLLESPEDKIELMGQPKQTEEQKPTLRIDIIKNGQHSVELPISEYDVLLALYQAGCDAPDAEYTLELDHYHEHWGEYENLDLTGANLQEMNFLAAKIADFDDYQKECFDAYAKTQNSITIKQAINAALNINNILWHPFSNDKELGEFALDNEMIEEYNHLPDSIYEALDKEKAGAKFREIDGGVFVNNGYLRNDGFSEIYNGITLPDSNPLSPFQICLHGYDETKTIWVNLPTDEDFDLQSRKHGAYGIHRLYLCDFRSAVPQINKKNCEISIDDFDELNELAKKIESMDNNQLLKYKAVLEVEQPFFIKDALDLCGKLNQYNIYSHLADPNDYGKIMVCDKFGFDYDDAIVNFIDNAEFGSELMKRNGIVPTQYGAVVVPPTFEETQSNEIEAEQDAAEDESEDQEFEGMQMT